MGYAVAYCKHTSTVCYSLLLQASIHVMPHRFMHNTLPSPCVMLGLQTVHDTILAKLSTCCPAAPIACCDFQLAGPRDTNWTATLDGKGNSSCPTEEDDSHAAHGAAAGMHGMEDMEGMNHTDHTGHNHSDHAGHDHSGHDHSAMGNATRAASGAANGTASALANGTRAASSGAALSTSWVSMAVAGAVILLAAALA